MYKEIAHIYRDADGCPHLQELSIHLSGVACMAATFASDFSMGDWGRMLGTLHDKGKERHSFQKYIRHASGYLADGDELLAQGGALPVNDPHCNDHNHAYVGALLAHKIYEGNHCWTLLANPLMGHHRGLYDSGEVEENLKAQLPKDVSLPTEWATLALPKLSWQKKDVHHLERMLYSCLVDADYLDTEAFMNPQQAELRGSKTPMTQLLHLLEDYLEEMKRQAPDTEVNSIRNSVQQYCRERSNGPSDFYSLTVPTGGGKTLSSVLWALRHAVANHLHRVIIAIPYTSIIVQTAHVLKGIFGEENVLEHHSEVDYSQEKESGTKDRIRLATENWDYPIIVTTNVQLFESLFSNKPSSCRKLHNIVHSVIILDEVQMLPTEFLQPIVDSLDTLKRIFGCSILFTTASQPVLKGTYQGTKPSIQFKGLPSIQEIVPPEAMLHDKLRRVRLTMDNHPRTYDEVVAQIVQHERVLCIVNTRKDAQEIYSRLPQEGVCLHLSRMMCPAHVRETLAQLKSALNDPGKKVIRVVSTQLIEAGVDIDFPVVFRQEAGLDSILQAAGRCNREGKQPAGDTYVFSVAREHTLPCGFIAQTNNARVSLGDLHDWFSPAVMESYFKQLYCRVSTFDKAKIADLLYHGNMQFETAAQDFHLIEDGCHQVVVNYGMGTELVEKLRRDGLSYNLMKRLSQYCVDVRTSDFEELKKSGAAEEVVDNIFYVGKSSFYDKNIGLKTDNQWLDEILIA